MPLVPINITGQQYQSRSGQLSNQVTQNFYAELVQDQFAKARYVLQPTPGMLLFGSAGSGTDRGIFEHLGVLYHVCGTTLYTVASTGVHTSRGTIAGTDRVIFTALGAGVIVVANAGSNLYLWDGFTLAAITDGDLETPASATTLNNTVIYQGDNGRWCTSDVGDSTSVNALNYATAESAPDSLVRVYAFNQRLYLFGQKTIEVWWNSGQGSPPFDRIEGGIMQVGLEAKHSVANNDHRMYWLGDDDQVYMLMEGAAQRAVSDIAMHSKVSAYGTTSDAQGCCFTFEGQEFYTLTFPTEDKTWLLNEDTGWSTLSSGTAGGRSLMNGCVRVFGKLIISDYASDDLHEWSATTYLDNNASIVRIRDTAPLHGGLFGAPGSKVEQNDLRLIVEVGVGEDTDNAYVPAGASITTPSSAGLDLLADIDIRAKIAYGHLPLPFNIGPTANLILASRWDESHRSYRFQINETTGFLQLEISSDGTSTAGSAICDVEAGFSTWETHWVRVTWDQSESECKFYSTTVARYDADSTDWDQIGATETLTASGAYDGTSALLIESNNLDPTPEPFEIHELLLYDGIAGTLNAHLTLNDYVSGTTVTSSATSEVWTLNGAVTVLADATNPTIALSISDDGGLTFSSEVEANLGAVSDGRREVRWNALGSFYSGRILRLKETGRVFTSIHGASSYIEVGI